MQSFFFKLSVIHMFESKWSVIELGEERALNCLTLQVYKSTGLFITFITHVLCFHVVFAFVHPFQKFYIKATIKWWNEQHQMKRWGKYKHTSTDITEGSNHGNLLYFLLIGRRLKTNKKHWGMLYSTPHINWINHVFAPPPNFKHRFNFFDLK